LASALRRTVGGELNDPVLVKRPSAPGFPESY
jgi:hypothetical protein